VSEPIAATLAGAKRVGRLHFLSEYPLFFRESAGLGWVLVGDAGHFKDPAGAQGISDALRQSERLASAIVQGTDGALAGWWKWRDRDAIQVHWFAADLGRRGACPRWRSRCSCASARRPRAAASSSTCSTTACSRQRC
jgi:2-polyprenyl-6-methoxyphenol hydroxylase-like FAD-dependent oxidoreductase